MNARSSLRWIPEAAHQLAAAGALRGRSWSLAQTCEHLALAIEGTVRDPASAAAPQSWRTLSAGTRFWRCCAKYGLLMTGRFPRGITAPDVVVPSDAPELDRTLAQLEQAAAAFEQKYARGAAAWVYHPLLGRMSGRQWRRFHIIHAAHHFAQFRPLGGR